MVEARWSVYLLSDPRTSEVRYVGCATRLKKRYSEHISSRRERTYKGLWIKSLLADGLRPVLAVIETGIGDGWQAREQFWIAHYRSQGGDLTNMTDGGAGAVGVIRSNETRKKLAVALTGKRRPREVVEKWLATKKSKGQSERQRAGILRVAQMNRGRKDSPETCRKKSIAMTGKKLTWSAEAKERQKGKGAGVPKTAAHRVNMAAAARRRGPVSVETRAKISAARTGKPLSEAHKLAISATLTGRRSPNRRTV